MKFKTCEQTTKPQTNYSCCLWFRLLMPYWLSLRNTKTFHEYFWCSRFCEFHSNSYICYIGFVFHNTQWTFLLDQFARCYIGFFLAILPLFWAFSHLRFWQWQLEAITDARDQALRWWQHPVPELHLLQWLLLKSLFGATPGCRKLGIKNPMVCLPVKTSYQKLAKCERR